MSATRKLWIGLVALILLTPLGLILPARFGAGSAWGEWSTSEIHKMVGYVPSGMSRLAGSWKSPMPDYAFRGQGNANASYIISAIVGVAIVAGVSILVGKVLAKRERD